MKARTGNYRMYRAIWSAISRNLAPNEMRIALLVVLLWGFGIGLGFADGSRDLYKPGTAGKRAYLFSRVSSVGLDDQSWPFRTYGDHFVYVNSGEVIAMASSAHGYGDVGGTIRLTSPSGAVTTFSYNGSGRIPNRAAELAGPQYPGQGAGGNRYLPHFYTANQSGVWKVEFLPVYESASPGETIDYYADDQDVSDTDWWQASTEAWEGYGQYIAAWDVSVWNGSGWISGRVYTTVMNLSIFPNFSTGFYGKMYPLTRDGWVYEVDNNGQNGLFFTFFVNNKGFYQSATNHMPSYESLDFSDGRLLPLIKDPRSYDSSTDVTCKMFYTYPDRSMPAKTNVYIGGKIRETWLMNSPTPPTIENLRLTGVEGTEGHASQKGGYIRFDASVDGIVRINFVLEGYAERTIETVAQKGSNAIFWDGKDGAGNYLPKGTIPAGVSVRLFGAEVHFPYIDTEINPNGIRIRRLDDTGPDADVVFWDDHNLSGGKASTRSNPVAMLDGISSAANGHKWGRNETASGGLPGGRDQYTYNEGDANYSFGNGRSMDTWAYIPSNTVTEEVELEVLAVDLGVYNLTKEGFSGSATVKPGDTWRYTVEVSNATGLSDAEEAEFALYLPSGIQVSNIADVDFSIVTGAGSEVSGSRGFDPATGKFHTRVNLPTGARVRFSIPVVVSPQAVPGSKVDVWATILRPADVYDRDATNVDPDDNGNVILPTDPFFECQGVDQVHGPFDPNSGEAAPCNNLAMDIGPEVLATPSIQLTKGISNANPITKVGDVINYVFEVSNPGNVSLTSLNLTDAQPGISAIAGPTYVTGNSDATLNPGEVWQYTATYTVQASDVTMGSVVNNASISATPTTGGGVTDAASVLTTIYNADLRVSKTVSNATPRVGSTVTFEIKVTNDGPSDAVNVLVTDVVPNGYTDIAAISGGGTLSGNTINWELSIANGDTQTVTYVAKVLAPDDGISHVNQVTVADADLYDPDTNNNTAEVFAQPRKAKLMGNPMIRSRLKMNRD